MRSLSGEYRRCTPLRHANAYTDTPHVSRHVLHCCSIVFSHLAPNSFLCCCICLTRINTPCSSLSGHMSHEAGCPAFYCHGGTVLSNLRSLSLGFGGASSASTKRRNTLGVRHSNLRSRITSVAAFKDAARMNSERDFPVSKAASSIRARSPGRTRNRIPPAAVSFLLRAAQCLLKLLPFAFFDMNSPKGSSRVLLHCGANRGACQ